MEQSIHEQVALLLKTSFQKVDENFRPQLKKVEGILINSPELLQQGLSIHFLNVCKDEHDIDIKLFFVLFLTKTNRFFTDEKSFIPIVNFLKTKIFSLKNSKEHQKLVQLSKGLIRDDTDVNMDGDTFYSSYSNLQKLQISFQLYKESIKLYTMMYKKILNHLVTCVKVDPLNDYISIISDINSEILKLIKNQNIGIKIASYNFVKTLIITSTPSPKGKYGRVFFINKGVSLFCTSISIKEDFFLKKIPPQFSTIEFFDKNLLKKRAEKLLKVLSDDLFEKNQKIEIITVVIGILLNISKQRDVFWDSIVKMLIEFDGRIKFDDNFSYKGLYYMLRYTLIYLYQIPPINVKYGSKLTEILIKKYKISKDFCDSMVKLCKNPKIPKSHKIIKKKRKSTKETPQSDMKKVKLDTVMTPLGLMTPLELANVVLNNLSQINTGQMINQNMVLQPTRENFITQIMNMSSILHPTQQMGLRQFISTSNRFGAPTNMNNNNNILPNTNVMGPNNVGPNNVINEGQRKISDEVRNVPKNDEKGVVDVQEVRDDDKYKGMVHIPKLCQSFTPKAEKISDENEKEELVKLLWDKILVTELCEEGKENVRYSIITTQIANYEEEGSYKYNELKKYIENEPKKQFDLLIQWLYCEFLNKRDTKERYNTLFLSFLLFLKENCKELLPNYIEHSPSIPMDDKYNTINIILDLIMSSNSTSVMVKIGFKALYNVFKKRWNMRKQCFLYLLNFAVNVEKDLVRDEAVKYLTNEVYVMNEEKYKKEVEKYAYEMFVKLLNEYPEVQDEGGKEGNDEMDVGDDYNDKKKEDNDVEMDEKKEEDVVKSEKDVEEGEKKAVSEWDRKLVKKYSSLFFACCTKNFDLFLKYVEVTSNCVNDAVRESLKFDIDRMILRIGINSKIILEFIRQSKDYALVLRVVERAISSRNLLPSEELIVEIKNMYFGKTKNIKFLLPIIPSLSKKEVYECFEDVLALENDSITLFLESLLTIQSISKDPISPREILLFLHKIDSLSSSESDGDKFLKLMHCTKVCLKYKNIYNSSEMRNVLGELIKFEKVPKIFFRTLIFCVVNFHEMKDFVLLILSEVIKKDEQVWNDPVLYQGLLWCMKREQLYPQIFDILVTLDDKKVLKMVTDDKGIKESIDNFIQNNKHLNILSNKRIKKILDMGNIVIKDNDVKMEEVKVKKEEDKDEEMKDSK